MSDVNSIMREMGQEEFIDACDKLRKRLREMMLAVWFSNVLPSVLAKDCFRKIYDEIDCLETEYGIERTKGHTT